jgi:hypothetical protein
MNKSLLRVPCPQTQSPGSRHFSLGGRGIWTDKLVTLHYLKTHPTLERLCSI